MKDSTILILIVGGFALLFWAFSRGLLTASPTGLGINPATGRAYGTVAVPQPSQNYSGYLAASTAPGVASALNGALSGIGVGLNNLFSGWLGSSNTGSGGGNQGPVAPAASAPSAAAQPSGPTPGSFYSGASAPAMLNATAYTPVGPVVPPDVSYAATPGSAFDYQGLSVDNSYDPSYSLQDPALAA